MAVDIDGGSDVDRQALIDEVDGAGYRSVVVPSGRPGHCHLLVACRTIADAGAAGDLLRTVIRHLGIDATVRYRQMLRPPGSPHRLGLSVACPDLSVFMRILGEPPPAPTLAVVQYRGVRSPMGSPRARRRLSSDTSQRLRFGDAPDRWHSRSEAVNSLVWGYVWAGRSFEDLLTDLRDESHVGGGPWRSIEAGEPRRSGGPRTQPVSWLIDLWNRACLLIPTSSTPRDAGRRGGPADGVVIGPQAAWLATVDEEPSWSARRWASIRLVAGVLAWFADGDGIVRITQRQLETATGLSRAAVVGAMTELRRLGCVVCVEQGRWRIDARDGALGTPSTYRLCTNQTTGWTTPDTSPRPALLPSRALDRAVALGLSPSMRLTLLHILNGGDTIEGIAAATRLSARSLTHNQSGRSPGPLAALVALGMARRRADGTYVATITKAAQRRARSLIRYGGSGDQRHGRRLVRQSGDRAAHLAGIARSALRHATTRIQGFYPTYPEPRCEHIARQRLPHLSALDRRSRTVEHARRRAVRLPSGQTVQIRMTPGSVWVESGDATVTRAALRCAGRRVTATRWVDRIRRNVRVSLGVIVDAEALAATAAISESLIDRLATRLCPEDWLAMVALTGTPAACDPQPRPCSV